MNQEKKSPLNQYTLVASAKIVTVDGREYDPFKEGELFGKEGEPYMVYMTRKRFEARFPDKSFDVEILGKKS